MRFRRNRRREPLDEPELKDRAMEAARILARILLTDGDERESYAAMLVRNFHDTFPDSDCGNDECILSQAHLIIAIVESYEKMGVSAAEIADNLIGDIPGYRHQESDGDDPGYA